ncbi:hypothetical protein FRB99_007078 [Tulasnella sp. 403]|nr:hypothetical protein FRB99_007078 [Tulasnella sp. 403]
MDEIIPNLYLGSLSSVYRPNALESRGIKNVLSALKGDLGLDPRLIRYQIALDDFESSNLLIHLPPCIVFIDKVLEQGEKVLVHCQAGISRSPSIVAAYLIYKENIDLKTALEKIKAARSRIWPNDSFAKQLELFHAAVGNIPLEKRTSEVFWLERTIRGIVHEWKPPPSLFELGWFPDRLREKEIAKPVRQRKIRCRACRQDLASHGNMMLHGSQPIKPYILPASPTSTDVADEPDQATIESSGPLASAILSERIMKGAHDVEAESDAVVPSIDAASQTPGALGVEKMMNTLETRLKETQGDDPSPSGPSEEPKATPSSDPLAALRQDGPPPPVAPPLLQNQECSGYFLEPMKWMNSTLDGGEVEGRLLCPNEKCKAKLGNFAWAGVKCGCGSWVTPGFCIHRGKVDELL